MTITCNILRMLDGVTVLDIGLDDKLLYVCLNACNNLGIAGRIFMIFL